jgi:hypothetical protein
MKLRIRRMNAEPKNRNLEPNQTLRESRAAPRPSFVPHNLGAPVNATHWGIILRSTQPLHSCFLGLLMVSLLPTKNVQMFKSHAPGTNANSISSACLATCENRLTARKRLSAHKSGPPLTKNHPRQKCSVHHSTCPNREIGISEFRTPNSALRIPKSELAIPSYPTCPGAPGFASVILLQLT